MIAVQTALLDFKVFPSKTTLWPRHLSHDGQPAVPRQGQAWSQPSLRWSGRHTGVWTLALLPFDLGKVP